MSSRSHSQGPARRAETGFTLVEVLIAATILVLAAAMGVMHVVRTSQHLDWERDRAFAREKAVSILDELRAYVEGGEGEAASDLDGFDDGITTSAVLTISPDPERPGQIVQPDHPVSSNVRNEGAWRFWRRIIVRSYGNLESRDLRFVTVRVYRTLPGEEQPGEQMAEASTVIRTIADSYPTAQVYDVFLLALENVPGWWVHMDAIQPFVEATLSDLEQRNYGLKFRTHWITTLGYGRDDEYAPYTNEERFSTDTTSWTYAYPGRMPDGYAALRYYVPGRMRARMNLDGVTEPTFINDLQPAEPWADDNANGLFDFGEFFVDEDGDGSRSIGNPVPYALADMHNHCKRWPEAEAIYQARMAAGLDDENRPSWRLLLDRMVSDPDRFHNAILINLHGELLPMPPARNVSDPAKDPVAHPGWRVVTHPERIRPQRVQGSDALSDAPRFRVYAWKTAFPDTEAIMTQREPLQDLDGDGRWDSGELYEDWNKNGVWDAGTPISIVIRDADLASAPNIGASPSIRVQCLSGGVDADADGSADAYVDWSAAHRYPEVFDDVNKDGIRQVVEPYFDVDGNGQWDAHEPWQELDGDGVFSSVTESLEDGNGNGRFDGALPVETFTDANGNGQWDGAEPYVDLDGNGTWTPATTPLSPWVPWDPAFFLNVTATKTYVLSYGEPFRDLDGDGAWDAAELFFDADGNKVCDGGPLQGEMHFEIVAEAAPTRTVLRLHGTPLETPYDAATRRGLPSSARLYDLDYIPCPTPSSSTGADRFARDLYTADDTVPRSTARWIIELPLDSVRTAYETSLGAGDGDAEDRLLAVETRMGWDLETGVLWPTRRDPQNLSTTYAWFSDDAEDLPFSERFQFQGDPRHCPYADLDRTGTTSPNGYNWFFDDLRNGDADARSEWLGLDGSRLRDGWEGRGSGHDIPRLMAWLRTALVHAETVYTTLTGFSYYYLSVGGDVGYDSANGFASSIPMDGRPFGLTGDVFENTITGGEGSSSVRGSLKYVRSNDGSTGTLRSGGYWWSKPWLGELFEDESYASQWSRWGNLRAASSTSSETYRLVRRGDVTGAQQPSGTTLVNRYARLASEGCTSLFNVGTSSSTFHHQFANGQTGGVVDDGYDLISNYNYAIPSRVAISRPFGLTTSGSGGVGDEFNYTTEFPRHQAEMVVRYYDHQNGQTGSGLVRLQEPVSPGRSGFITVNGLDRTLESGSAFIARYSVLSLLHGYFAAGGPGVTGRISQLPRVKIESPTQITELENPGHIPVTWNTRWTRWDGSPYTTSYASDFTEDESDVVYVPLYSADGGRTWHTMLDDVPAEPGVLPWIDGSGPDPAKTLGDLRAGQDEVYAWPTPADRFPEGSYLIRIEAWRAGEALHHAHHAEKIYVQR